MSAPTAAVVFDDYNTNGVPSSGPKKVKKSEARSWGAWLESFLTAVGANSGSVFQSRALLFADLAHAANSMAWVINDPTVAYNGIYQKVGASGFGSWTRVGDLPYSFNVATDVGAGTPNAIQATTSLPVSSSSLVWLSVFETNTSSPVTISFNGDANLTIKTNSGNDPVAGGIPGGSIIMGVRVGDTFRLVSDQSSAAIQAAAEAAAEAAADYADFIRNNWTMAASGAGTGVDGDTYTLSVDPGSVNNMFVVIGGVFQMLTRGAFELVYVSTVPKVKMTVPAGEYFEVRVGNAVAVGTPSDGTVSTPKIADGAVTYAKLQDISATLRLLGRKTAGAGDAEEISLAELRDLFLPSGSVIQSLYVGNTLSTAIASAIPTDDTVPLSTEGTLYTFLDITPVASGNFLDVEFNSTVCTSINTGVVVAMFIGTTCIGAKALTTASDFVTDFTMKFRTPVGANAGVLTRINVRVGSAGTLRMNGTSSARLLGGAQSANFIVSEIKG
ncbi:hypothetical protein HFO82_31725 [Rhizobium leguminosarum]|uniref:hypothetical protein n=1 Tax=Rhizobium leguminosarum TaxID=384 RepID=UPI00104084BE|nr:hypothetical protein [Rhizobium leguminosarum]MBY5503145.1 hypothetical protein [Rhizobium leguminosarum]NKK31562.1 hypothetical protein [Rhizobium leguminosarum bv. viciae]TBZ45486.1 hypothetical protein E0H42_30480 [Rhizobium leguminosarum bv. viciae]